MYLTLCSWCNKSVIEVECEHSDGICQMCVIKELERGNPNKQLQDKINELKRELEGAVK